MKGRWDGVMKEKRDAKRGNHATKATQTSCLIGHKRPHKFCWWNTSKTHF